MSDKSKPAPEPESGAQLRGTLENKTSKPAGLLPRNTQQFVILGVAVVMVLIAIGIRNLLPFLPGRRD